MCKGSLRLIAADRCWTWVELLDDEVSEELALSDTVVLLDEPVVDPLTSHYPLSEIEERERHIVFVLTRFGPRWILAKNTKDL